MYTFACSTGCPNSLVILPVITAVCHCTHCQKTSGGAGSVNAVLPRTALKVTGTPKRYAAKADSGRTLMRYFCGECGSPIYSHRETTPETVVVRAGGGAFGGWGCCRLAFASDGGHGEQCEQEVPHRGP